MRERPGQIRGKILTPGRVAVFATIAATLLVGWNLGARSLWLDEAFSVEIAGGTWAHLWERLTTHEANAGFYFVLLHGWLALGRDEATVRALSAIATVATVPLAYWSGVRLIGAPAAAFGVVLLATQPFALRYGQEARSYSLVVLLVVGSSLALMRMVERPGAGRWAVWVTFAVLAIYAHLLAVLALGAQLLAVAARGRVMMLAAAAGVVGILVAPLLWFAATRDSGQISWLSPPAPWQVLA